MTDRMHILASRVMLFVLLATFLSPNLGWQMVASHDQLEHAVSPSHTDMGTDHDEHDNAHGAFGHLLTHMPIHLSNTTFELTMVTEQSEFIDPGFSLLHRTIQPPFRPPRTFSLV